MAFSHLVFGCVGNDSLELPDATIDVDAARSDAGTSMDAGQTAMDAETSCETNFDCELGEMCVEGRCQSDAGGSGGTGGGDCETNFDCPPGQYCVDGTCSSMSGGSGGGTGGGMGDGSGSGGGCCSGEPCPGDTYCDFDSCMCVGSESLECDPPCETGFVCDWGICSPECYTTGCPDGEICSETGCTTPLCTYEECIGMSPPRACDPYSLGCYDPCDATLTAECEGMGMRCFLGTCVDDGLSSCSSLGCSYREDCCGAYHCMRDDQPDPMCPESCGATEDAPPANLCVCEVYPTFGGGGPAPDGYCSDLRWYAGFMPPELGGPGGMGGEGGLPALPPGSAGDDMDAGVPVPADPDAG